MQIVAFSLQISQLLSYLNNKICEVLVTLDVRTVALVVFLEGGETRNELVEDNVYGLDGLVHFAFVTKQKGCSRSIFYLYLYLLHLLHLLQSVVDSVPQPVQWVIITLGER